MTNIWFQCLPWRSQGFLVNQKVYDFLIYINATKTSATSAVVLKDLAQAKFYFILGIAQPLTGYAINVNLVPLPLPRYQPGHSSLSTIKSTAPINGGFLCLR
jgi:hypothetical protein